MIWVAISRINREVVAKNKDLFKFEKTINRKISRVEHRKDKYLARFLCPDKIRC